jgi:hypothetical protein
MRCVISTASWLRTSVASAEGTMGGSVDHETGEVEWEMHVAAAEQLAHYRAHPPRAVAGLRVTPIEVDFPFDGHGEPINAIFEVACPCGSTRFTVSGGLDEDEEIRDPIELSCAECEVGYDVFDASEHGYDGELRDTPLDSPGSEARNERQPTDFDAPHEIVVRFEYASEELGNPTQAADRRNREQDLFTWFTLLARDPATKQLACLYESECA